MQKMPITTRLGDFRQSSHIKQRQRRRKIFLAWMGLSLLSGGGSLGCTRAHYRLKADEETYALIDEKVCDLGSGETRSIQVDQRSRMFDPFNPDRPPMPEDDPAAHRYMQVLDKKKHYPLWDVNGHTNATENPVWWQYLPLDERGVLVLDIDTAVKLAQLHSVNYQAEIETMYLSALDVSSERFLLDTQFFGGYGVQATTDGPDRRGSGGESRSDVTVGPFSRGRRPLSLQRRFATGADLVVGFANSLTWQLSGPDTQAATTLLDFSFVQPLLRQGGRDVILERLTLAERTLLYNVRAFERYRTGFYLTVANGRAADAGPTRRGGLFGGAGLEGFSGLGGGFGAVGTTLTPNAGGGGNNQAVPGAQGFLGLLQNQRNLRNTEDNIARLRDEILRFEDRLREQLTTIPDSPSVIPTQQLQVASLRSTLIQNQNNLLQARATYEQTLDTFKQQTLGIPSYICVEIRDPLLDQFELISLQLRDRREELANLRDSLGNFSTKILEASKSNTDPESGENFRTLEMDQSVLKMVSEITTEFQGIEQAHRSILTMDVKEIESDIQRLANVLEQRKTQLDSLKTTFEQERDLICSLLPTGALDSSFFNSADLLSLPEILSKELKRLQVRFEAYGPNIKKLQKDTAEVASGKLKGTPRDNFKTIRDKTILQSQDLLAAMAEDILAMQVLQARAKSESIVLPDVELDVRQAVEIAKVNRVDWFNARASLVDSWRSIEVVADDLESSLDLVFSGDLQNINDNPLSLRGTTGRLRAGLQWDSPLTRLQERNRYRQSLIEYQQARRRYYQFEDTVWFGLRSQLRTIRLNQINFELQRYAVRNAATQILLREDVRQVNEASGQDSPTAAQDTINALNALLTAQNQFLGIWVNYESQRRNLDQDLGTMRLDAEGLWIDPGPIKRENFYVEPLFNSPEELQGLPADLSRDVTPVVPPVSMAPNP